MTCIITRKDHTSIACINTSVTNTARKLRFMEVALAIALIVVGASLMLVV